VRAGLAQLEAGGDFADAVIAHSGRDLGGETFVSFDKKAVDLLGKSGETAHLLK
jgi:predicted nucleic-acid-binding protein